MSTEELEVYITPNGLGRVAIVRRPDGLFCIYRHWIFSKSARALSNMDLGGPESWHSDPISAAELYKDAIPLRGLYGTIDDARREIKSLPGFSEETLKSSD